MTAPPVGSDRQGTEVQRTLACYEASARDCEREARWWEAQQSRDRDAAYEAAVWHRAAAADRAKAHAWLREWERTHGSVTPTLAAAASAPPARPTASAAAGLQPLSSWRQARRARELAPLPQERRP